MRRVGWTIAAIGLLAAMPVGAQVGGSAPDTARLHRALDSLAAAHHGVVGYSVTDLASGAHLERRGDEPFPTASLIKVAVLVTLFDLVKQGTIRLDAPLTLLKIDKVPGAGTLQFMHDGMVVSVGDAAWLMSTISDNTATNLILDRIGLRAVGRKMEALGLPRTKIHAKVFKRETSVAPDSSIKYGLGVSTPNEMVRLFALLARGQAVSGGADSTMLDVLEHNEDGNLLQRFAGGTRAAHKTGATDDVRTECSLFYLTTPVVACVFTRDNADQRWVLDSEPQLTLARMGEWVVRTFK